MNIAERLENLRAARTLSWGELCEELDIKRSMLHYLRNGDRGPSPKLLRRIEQAEIDAGIQPAEIPKPQPSNAGNSYPESHPTPGVIRKAGIAYGTVHKSEVRDPSHNPRALEMAGRDQVDRLEARLAQMETKLDELVALIKKGKG